MLDLIEAALGQSPAPHTSPRTSYSGLLAGTAGFNRSDTHPSRIVAPAVDHHAALGVWSPAMGVPSLGTV
jgi:hypothetical protein